MVGSRRELKGGPPEADTRKEMSTSGGPSTTTQSDVLALVREVTAAVASSSDIDETLARIAHLIGQTFGVDECDIYEYTPRERKLRATATWNTVTTADVERGVARR